MKKITSLSLMFSFLIMGYTGVMLFLCPHGKVAYWSDWHLFGLSKTQYGEIHTTSMLLFLIFGILHVYYNWKPIVSYLKDSSKKISFTKKEFLIALLLNVIFVAGTLFSTQPFKAFLDFEEGIKDSWTVKYGEPPYGHAEDSKLSVFCKKMGIDLENAKEILTKNKIIFKENQSLKTISNNNNISSNDIFKLIKKEGDAPSNLGRKTLKNLGDMKKIDIQKAIELLKAKGLNDVDENSKMRHIADELELNPSDIYELITK